MRRHWQLAGVLMMLITFLTGCGADSSGSQQPSYKDMKSMVIDILKTEDAQKALQESTLAQSGGGTIGMLSVQDQEQVRLAVKEVLVSPDYNKVIEKLMTDPKFAGEFAKAVNKQNKQIHKDLMKDPSYQQDLVQVLRNPEMEKLVLEVLESAQYRKQVASIMQETMQSPLVKLQLLELLQKAVHEELRVKPDEKLKKDDQQNDSGGSYGESDESSKTDEDSQNQEDSMGGGGEQQM